MSDTNVAIYGDSSKPLCERLAAARLAEQAGEDPSHDYRAESGAGCIAVNGALYVPQDWTLRSLRRRPEGTRHASPPQGTRRALRLRRRKGR